MKIAEIVPLLRGLAELAIMSSDRQYRLENYSDVHYFNGKAAAYREAAELIEMSMEKGDGS
jgi:hypothetical protein